MVMLVIVTQHVGATLILCRYGLINIVTVTAIVTTVVPHTRISHKPPKPQIRDRNSTLSFRLHPSC